MPLSLLIELFDALMFLLLVDLMPIKMQIH